MYDFSEFVPALEAQKKFKTPRKTIILFAGLVVACLIFVAAPLGYGLSLVLAGLTMALAALIASVQTNTPRSEPTGPEQPPTV